MKIKLLFLFALAFSISVFAENNDPDSIFFKSFNLRYQNPNEGIRIAKELIKYDPQKAYLSLAYNYFFLSDYDSTTFFINRAININMNDELILNLGRSSLGWIAQRIGRYYDAYQYFDTANTFYEKKSILRKYENDQLFSQGYILNLLGKLSFQYSYVNNFNKMKTDFDFLNNYIGKIKVNIPNDLMAHIQYLYIQNYLYNNIDPISIKPEIKIHILKFISLVDSTDYQQAGNLFEIFGLLLLKVKDKEFLNDFLLPSLKDNSLCWDIYNIINTSPQPKLEILKQSLKYYKKHGDPYHIAGSYYDIAEYYSSLIKNDLDSNITCSRYMIDSLKKYIGLSKLTYESRYPQYFNSKFESQNIRIIKDSVDQFISNLISYSCYINALKLQDFAERLYYPAQNIDYSFNKRLVLILENEDKKNTSSFYSKMELTLTKKYELEKSQNWINIWFIIIILAVFLAVFQIVFLYRRKRRNDKEKADFEKLQTEITAKIEIQLSKTRLEEWNKILNEILNLKEHIFSDDETSLKFKLNPLNKMLCQYFDAEYCAIGIIEGEAEHLFLNDVAYFFKKELDELQKREIQKLLKNKLEDTIIGQFLSTKKDFLEFNEEEISKIENKHLMEYKMFFPFHNIDRINLAGIYSSKYNIKDSLGYISLINVRNDQEDDLRVKINQLCHQIAVLFITEENRRTVQNRNRDIAFINSLTENNIGIDEIVKKSLDYFAKEFDARIISFRVPVINGPDEKPEENLKLVLRDIFIHYSIPNHQKINDYYWNEKKILSLSDVTYKNVMLSNFPDEIYFDEIGQDSNFYFRFDIHNIFASKTNIIFPIKKALLQTDNNEEIGTYWRNIYGIFNLQLYQITDVEQINGRLRFLSTNISYVINSIISRKKYSQIAILHNEIDKLNYEELGAFYHQIAYMIKTVINAETCSVFIYSKYNNRLELKATTAKRAIFNNKEIDICENEFIEDIYYDMNDTDSITLQSYIENKTYMIYSLSSYRKSSLKFVELTQQGDIQESEKFTSLLVPLKSFDNQKDCFGVIKCLGARIPDQNLLHSFWDFDHETVEFISALAARFIVNAQLSFEKDNFVKQVVHEILSPITEMMHRQVEYYNRLQRLNRLPLGFESHHRNILNNIMLQKQILLDLSDVSMKKSDLMNINPAKENVKMIITDIVKIFKDSALDEKNITIIPNVSELPELNIDRSKMQQVFINLLKNAINYSYKNSIICIYYNYIEKYEKGYSNLKWHEIKFVNDGIGIHENETKDIFLLYKRGSNASMLKPSGSGIGLFLVDKIIKAHGGFCKVVKPNNPTEISIYLPAK